MNHQKSEFYFLVALLLGALFLVFSVLRPFLYALVSAMVFAVIFEPFHRRVLGLVGGRRDAAAFLTALSVLVVVIAPIVFLGTQIFREATQLYVSLAGDGGVQNVSRVIGSVMGSLERYFAVPAGFSVDVSQYVRDGLNWLLQHLGALFSNLARIAVSFFVFFLSLYYLLKDGRKLKEAITAASPLADAHDEMIFEKLALATNSVVRGKLVIAIVQGVLAGAGFALFGVPNAVLWGSVTAVTALIPGIGTALVIVPAAVFLFFGGERFGAVGLLAWGLVAVGLVDNFLGPKLIERGVQVHPLLIMLSILGGLAFFGPIGFLLGPLTLSLFFALLDIYFSLAKEHAA